MRMLTDAEIEQMRPIEYEINPWALAFALSGWMWAVVWFVAWVIA